MVAAQLERLYQEWGRPEEAEPYREAARRWQTRHDED
jgi:hypothetical protein